MHTLNQVLSLPAVQRHALGEDFARFTLRRWPWDAAAEIYAERFAALVGRPQIPVDLRAAGLRPTHAGEQRKERPRGRSVVVRGW